MSIEYRYGDFVKWTEGDSIKEGRITFVNAEDESLRVVEHGRSDQECEWIDMSYVIVNEHREIPGQMSIYDRTTL